MTCLLGATDPDKCLKILIDIVLYTRPPRRLGESNSSNQLSAQGGTAQTPVRDHRAEDRAKRFMRDLTLGHPTKAYAAAGFFIA